MEATTLENKTLTLNRQAISSEPADIIADFAESIRIEFGNRSDKALQSAVKILDTIIPADSDIIAKIAAQIIHIGNQTAEHSLLEASEKLASEMETKYGISLRGKHENIAQKFIDDINSIRQRNRAAEIWQRAVQKIDSEEWFMDSETMAIPQDDYDTSGDIISLIAKICYEAELIDEVEISDNFSPKLDRNMLAELANIEEEAEDYLTRNLFIHALGETPAADYILEDTVRWASEQNGEKIWLHELEDFISDRKNRYMLELEMMGAIER